MDNLQPETKLQNKINTKKIVLISIAVLILIITSFLAVENFFKKELPVERSQPIVEPPKPLPSPPAPSLEDMRKVIINRSVLKFPAVINKEEIPPSLLSQDLARFIRPEAENLMMWRVVYENGAKGFEIQYVLSGISLADLDNEFGRTSVANNWQLLMGLRSNLFALKEIENSKYQIKLSQSAKENNVIAVSIEILSK